MIPVLYLIIPCYNEEKVLPLTMSIFVDKIQTLIGCGKIHKDSRIVFVDDGSSDGTWTIISEKSQKDDYVTGIRQSRNRGHQSAVLAGLMEAAAYADITISIDCDGQDDIHAVDDMIKAWENGAEVVYGVRKDRSTDTLVKRSTALFFYQIMRWLGAETVFNHADYRLVSVKVLKAFENFKEVNIFLRGMFPLVGFQSTCVYYDRRERMAGKTHYTLRKMAGLAIDGITSLSIRPIRLITGLGFLISVFGFLAVIWAICTRILGYTVDGWASVICIVAFMGGIQLLSLGVIGEYIGKIYMETKERPRYIISEYAGKEKMIEKEL